MIITVDKKTIIDTLTKAIKLAKDNDTIQIMEGDYYEKVKITKSNIKIKGIGRVRIINNDYALKIHQDGKEYNTFRTYTLEIIGNNLEIDNVTIINSSGDGKIYGQAVALATIGDNITFNDCTFDAYQDTIFVGPLPLDLINRYQGFLEKDELVYPINHRVYFNNCVISGDVDFIFGAGSGIFNKCIIYSKERWGFVCAPATEKDDDEGFIFNDCTFKSNFPTNKSYLARPWRDYGKVTFTNCSYENHIIDEGFDKWGDTNRDKSARFYEINCHYIDNHPFKRVNWINK